MGWIEPVMVAAGLHVAYDIETRTQPHCVFRVYRDRDKAQAFRQEAQLPADPYGNMKLS